MVPGHINNRIFRLDRVDAFMASQVLVRKIEPTSEQWNVDMDGLVEDVYPA
jgi:hypothetical protein